MKKANRVLALVLALVMLVSVGVPTAFAKNASNIYEPASMYPDSYTDGVEKYKFTMEQGAGYVVDMLEMLLHELDLDLSREPITHVDVIGDVYLLVNFQTIDSALSSLYDLVIAVRDKKTDDINRIVDLSSVPNLLQSAAITIAKGFINFGDLNGLTLDAIGNQRGTGTDRLCRNVPYSTSKVTKSDFEVLHGLVRFLSDNRGTLSKIADGSIDFGTLNDTIKGIKGVGPFLKDLPTALRKLLHQKLIDSDYDTDTDLPADGNTLDKDVQKLINWLLITGTGADSSNGGKSVLGADKEGFLPDIGNYPGGASIDARTIQADRGEGVRSYTMNFYQLVNNALNALLSGMVSDLLEGLLFDMLGIDASDGMGDPEVMQDVMFATITGAIEGLCVQNGAPAITYTDTENSFPVPKIRKLLNWFFVGGGLATFVKISYSGIQITDNFMSLLNDVARMLPGLFPLFGFEVPEGLTYTTDEMNEKWVDRYPDQPYFLTYQGEEVIKIEDNGNDFDNDDTYAYVSNNAVVNTSNPNNTATFRNPDFIRPKYVLTNQNIYAALVKILLNHFIDGCYFPEWADSIPSVGAYALASLGAQYLPENNYFDRLDAYHYITELNGTYQPKGVSGTVEPLPYTEEIVLPTGTHAVIPRAAMDIGASIGAYLLSGWQDFQSGVGYVLETDTNFEVFALEFITWACATYMPIFAGKWNAANANFDALTGCEANWRDAFNTARAAFNNALANHPRSGVSGNVNNIPAGEIRTALFDLVDNTIFQLIPFSWLPDWVAPEKSAGLFNIWLFQSICTLDLQKIISILGVNSTGELNNSVTVVLLRLVDRVLGTLVGGHPLLPDVSRASVYDSAHPTSLTTLDGLLGNKDNTPLKSLLTELLYQLNRYLPTLAQVIMPLLMSGTVKDAEYYTSDGANSKYNPIGSGVQITADQLHTYNDNNGADKNSTKFSGTVWYTTEAKAELVADAIGVGTYTTDTVGGSEKYGVAFPETYASLRYAEAAQNYVDNSYAKRDRSVSTHIVYNLYVSENYRDESSTEATNVIREDPNTHAILEKEYVYSNFHTAPAVKTGGTYQTSTHGEVVYGDGWKTLAYEDFRSNQIHLYHRYKNAIDDSNEFLDSFDSYAHSTLPNAYGEWLMYIINMKLYNSKKYDANGDGVVNSDDGMPGKPAKDTPYPFYAGSGTAYEDYIGPDNGKINIVRNEIRSGTSGRPYAFSSNNAYKVVEEALAWADATEEDGSSHDVTLSRVDAQSVVRLALGNYTFDITSGDEDAALAEWAGLSNANYNSITSTCNSYGLTFDYDAENKTYFKITRKSFALITPNLAGGSFGVYRENQIDSTGEVALSLTPVTSFILGSVKANKEPNKVKNEILKSYITFAKEIRDYNLKLNAYYDNISWRLAKAETALESKTVRTNTLKWVLAYTKDAWKITYQNPETGNQEVWRNKVLTNYGTLRTAYTAKTYEEFQKAYEYGDALRNAIDNNNLRINQSLVTTAYQAILKAYYNLHKYTSRPDWTVLEATMAQAQAILEGPFGLGDDVDRDLAYTLASLNNLDDALDIAQAYYAQWYTDADGDFQPEIDEQNQILKSVIDKLKWPDALKPGAVKSNDPNAVNSPLNILADSNGVDYTYGLGGLDTLTYKVILGLTEGQSFTDDEGRIPTFTDSHGNTADVFNPNGYVADETVNTFVAKRSPYGGGTGSYLVGSIGRIPQFKYYAVLVGDLNGDARIDSVDKTYINLLITTEQEVEPYIGVAGDVNFDGQITAADAQIIGYKVEHDLEHYQPIDQSGDDVGANWFDTIDEGND